MKKIDERGDGTLGFAVSLSPRSSRDTVVGWTPAGALKIAVTAAPADGAANRRLIEVLSGALDAPKSEIVIAAGLTSRSKRLVVPASCKNRLLRFSDI